MRLLRRLFWYAGAVAFLLWAASPLVRGPEAERVSREETPRPAAVYAAEMADVPIAAQTPPQARRLSQREAAEAPVRLGLMPVLVCDRNGTPLTGETWAESGYLARPPESLFG
ncbi:MAG: hypothetical protein IKP40_05875 [Clostridia bacterium]|nr:hypothetical protein [Clostridia bacterium]